MKRTLFIWGIYFLSFASTTFATGIAIQTLFPNTSNDAALEYIEVLNSGCNSINLSGFSLKDASGKVFLFPQEVLDPKITRRFLRGETGIILNNSDEVVELFDSSGLLVDRVQYSSTTKDKKIVFDVAHDICETPLEVESLSFSGATELELLPQDVVNENILSHETY